MSPITVKIKVLRKGDVLVNVWADRIAIRRKSGEVDVLRLCEDEHGMVRLDFAHSYKITFGNHEVELTKTRSPRSSKKKPSRNRGNEGSDEIKVSTF